MTATPHEIVSLPTRGRHLYRRTQGLLESYFCSRSWGGGLRRAYVPAKLIVSADATATAHNIQAFDSLFPHGLRRLPRRSHV